MYVPYKSQAGESAPDHTKNAVLHDAAAITDVRDQLTLANDEGDLFMAEVTVKRTQRLVAEAEALETRAQQAGGIAGALLVAEAVKIRVGAELPLSRSRIWAQSFMGNSTPSLHTAKGVRNNLDEVIGDSPQSSAREVMNTRDDLVGCIDDARIATKEGIEALPPSARQAGSADFITPHFAFVRAQEHAAHGRTAANTIINNLRQYADDLSTTFVATGDTIASPSTLAIASTGEDYYKLLKRLNRELTERYEANDWEQGTEDHIPFLGKRSIGPYYEEITKILRGMYDELQAIDSGLGPQHLHASSYMHTNDIRYINQLPLGPKMQFWDVHNSRNRRFEALGNRLYADDADVELAEGILNRPPYLVDRSEKSCAIDAFRMVFAGITGDKMPHNALSDTINGLYGTTIPKNETLLNMLESDSFQASYGQNVNTVVYTGTTLQRLAAIATKLKSSNPQRKVHLVTSIRSAKGAETSNVWHNVVINKIDREQLAVYDPSQNTGRDTILTKKDFAQRWAAAYNSGYLVVSSSRQ